MAKKPNKHTSLLWKVESPFTDAPSFIFGTMHVKDQRAFNLLSQVYPYIEKCKSFSTEFNLEEMAFNADVSVLNLPPDQSIEKLLGQKRFDKLRRLFQKAVDVDILHYNHSLPLILANIINERLLSEDNPVSLDMHLWNFAKAKGKIRLGVETYQEQIDILAKIPMDYQLKALKGMAKNFNRHRKNLIHMTKQYEQANIRQLYKSSLKSSGKIKKMMIFDRNEIMADRIYDFIHEQSMFCAIGAGHLGGNKGVLRLLKLQDLKVTPILLHKI